MLTTDQILDKMAAQGLRITEQRRTLAKLFADTDGFLTPKDVYEFMGKRYSGLSFDTVYRNLRVMHELGVLEQIVFEDGVKFRVHCAEAHHHHHMICLQCEKTYPIHFCPMPLTDVPEKFQVVKHKFEVFGYCEACSHAAGSEAGAVADKDGARP
ncbi:transcriptional repressor [Paenibacillus thiaminolyticus]|uniref:Transcriptional repressor n=1 Tax=Paenibacillus thiaminolyticus TaxID=49283 RepID=A0AAP9J0I9_PANTH|nr:Fur family transcriptional regulator [Paenibacillus thiaminolyticus]MCY9536375.1 transcriptional repressor [Paenibacillus thiaminolyticus]MCY9601387.1 transcriptional repressor [Paenibacillus thiaminolyticus]MCY9609291.1 transcriptional repressor [Paenibacillus thiaminolyticus]MCY9613042.1 transcriptional repressor [Paenibacillus thiaminolyticus]MCY9616974.1 transcriptional repressor [Paenibacillus thiaminolyticus]